MFGGLSNLAKMAAQAGQMRGRMEEMQKRLPNLRTTAEAGGVLVEATGALDIVRIEIAEHLVESGERERMERLVTAAVNQALRQARELAAGQMSEVMGGDMPGLGDALKSFGLGG